MLESKGKKESIRIFMITLLVFSFGIFLMNYDGVVASYNSTALAFSYKYGFISRALIGSVYLLLNKILPVDMMNYGMAVRFTRGITLIFYLILFFFFYLCLVKCREMYLKNMEIVIVVFALLAVSMFCSERNFGRLDIYMLALSIVGAILLIWEKAELLLIPISALGVMVHQGYVFMFVNIILVLLLYKALSGDRKKRKKYILLFTGCFVTVSVLFIWFELLSHANGQNIYEEIVRKATMLSHNGEYHETLIAHEILGVDLTRQEWPMHLANFIETPIFLLLVSPYIVFAVQFFKGIIQSAKTKMEKWKYMILVAGAGTMLPDFILKVDYGRWFFAVIAYYAVVILALLAMQDEVIETQLSGLMYRVKEKYSWSILLLPYIVFFIPVWDVHICQLMHNISTPLNEMFFHFW